MASIKLKKLLTDLGLTDALLAYAQTHGQALHIEDANGRVLIAQGETEAETEAEATPLQYTAQVVGQVRGDATLLLPLLQALVRQEGEKRELAAEVLDKYRELSALYEVARRLTSLTQVADVVRVASEETQRVLKSGGSVYVLRQTSDPAIYSPGKPDSGDALRVQLGSGLLGDLIEQRRAEVVNRVTEDPRAEATDLRFAALLAAPLETHEGVLGLLLVGSDETDVFSAGDLKLLMAIASQTAPILDNAIRYEQALQAANEREARLKQEIENLRIELDETQKMEQVKAITGSDYFLRLKQHAQQLRDELGD